MHQHSTSLWSFLKTLVILSTSVCLLYGCSSTPKTEENNAVTQDPDHLKKKTSSFRKWLNKLSPYKMPIQQGNFVSSEMLANVKPGMRKEQVRYILGTPLLTDMFHASRWDYLFRLQKPNGELTMNRVTIFFTKDGIVERILNDALLNENDYLSSLVYDEDREAKRTQKKAQEAQKTAQQQGVPQRQMMSTTAQGTTVVPATGTQQQASSSRRTTTQQPTQQGPAALSSTVAPVQGASQPTTQGGNAVTTAEPIRPAGTAQTNYQRSTPQRTIATKQIDIEDDDEMSSSTIGTFNSISIPRRTGRMLPETPNDEMIGNVQ